MGGDGKRWKEIERVGNRQRLGERVSGRDDKRCKRIERDGKSRELLDPRETVAEIGDRRWIEIESWGESEIERDSEEQSRK